jgi:hypothetical protein
LDKIDKTKLAAGIFNPVTLTSAFVFLLNNITVQGLAFFLPTIVRTIYPEASRISQQLYTVPPYAVGAFFTLLIPGISSKIDKRQMFVILSGPGIAIGYAIFLGTTNQQARYGATFLITSFAFFMAPILNSHISANVVSDTARSTAIGTNGKSRPELVELRLLTMQRSTQMPQPTFCRVTNPLSNSHVR